MAFTKEQIVQAFTFPVESAINSGSEFEEFEKSDCYLPIVDFLTGKSSALPGMQTDYFVRGVVQLLTLLRTIDDPSDDDKLVLQVMHHPDLYPYTKYFYSHWLLRYALKHNDTNGFVTVKAEYHSIGLKDADIFNFFVVNIGPENYNEDDISGTVIENFLLSIISKGNQLIYPKSTVYLWTTSWSLFYLQLLEKVNQQFASEYVWYGAIQGGDTFVRTLVEYRDGYYIPGIIALIQDEDNPDLQAIQAKLAIAIRLYENNRHTYAAVAVDLGIRYLEFLKNNHPTDKWEAGIHVKGFVLADLYYIPYSAFSFHVLLQEKKDRAIEILNGFYDSKAYIAFVTLQIVQFHLGKDAFPYLEKAVASDKGSIEHYRQIFGLLQTSYEPKQYIPLVWKLAGSKSRTLKELFSKIVVGNDTNAESTAIKLLLNKSAEIRQTAAMVLSQISSPTAIEAITEALNKETNDNTRDVLLQAVEGSMAYNIDEKFVEATVGAARERGKLSKPVEPWLEETLLPPLYAPSGDVLPGDYVRFLLYRMSRVKEMRSDIEARYIIQLVDKEKAAPFALELIRVYLDKGAEPETKYLMALSALLGDDAVIEKLRLSINKWMDVNRYKMAEYGVGALALNGSKKALRLVEWYSRKYRTKKANVGAAALVALEIAATELGITIQELGDRVVPDFGFDGLLRHFTIDGNEYRAFIDSKFKIAFFDEDNRKLKSIPASASPELKEEFKYIAKEIREVVRSQSSRLEYYLIIQRRWEFSQWQQFFLQNPVMFIYATRLLWGIYDTAGNLLEAFRCDENTDLIDINNEEINIEAGIQIGIVYPSQLSDDLLQKWKRFYFEASIETIFPQLERTIPDLSDFDLSKAIITKYDGRIMVTGSIRSTLEKYGWQRGPVGDGGMVATFHLIHTEKAFEAVLEVDGVGAGYGWGGDERTGRLYVLNKIQSRNRWITSPQNDSDDRLIKLKDLPVIFLNEMLAAIEMIKQKQQD